MSVSRLFHPIRRASRYLLGLLAGLAVTGVMAANRYPWNEDADRRCLRWALGVVLSCRDSCRDRLGPRGEVVARGTSPDACCERCSVGGLGGVALQCRNERFLREHDQYRHQAE